MAKEEEKTAPPAASEPVTPKSDGGSKMPVILAVLNLLLTVGIGAVVYLQFQHDQKEQRISDIRVSDPSQPGNESEKAAEAKAVAVEKTKVLSLDQFTVNLSTAVGAPPKFARVMIAIEVTNDDTSEELTQRMPQVRNSIIDLFNSKRPADLQTGEGRNFLKEEIRNTLNSFLVTGKVKSIFFSNFSVSN